MATRHKLLQEFETQRCGNQNGRNQPEPAGMGQPEQASEENKREETFSVRPADMRP
jgi:hypothetical protein